MKKIFYLGCLFIIAAAAMADSQTLTGDEILRKVDENFGSDNKIMVGSMVIHGRRGSRSVKSKTWLQGINQSYTEYLAPPREKGTKMLKLEDQLWTYSPSTDRIIKISGHMLRQSVMGSDLSYEDMMEDPELYKLYDSVVLGEESILDRLCWVIELTSKSGEIAYNTRKVWVDKQRYVVLKEDRFARSGKLLKTIEVKNVSLVQNRWIPNHTLFKDVLKRGQGTEFVLESIEFNAVIPDHVFTKASLRR